MTYTVQFADLQAQDAAVVRKHVAGAAELPEFLGAAFGEVAQAVAAQGLSVEGAPFGRYVPTGDGGFDVEVGFPVSGSVKPSGRVEPDRLPVGRVARTLHVGSYDTVAAAYEAARSFVVDNGCEVTDTPWEAYLDAPDVPQPRTEVFMPCREVRPREDTEA